MLSEIDKYERDSLSSVVFTLDSGSFSYTAKSWKKSTKSESNLSWSKDVSKNSETQSGHKLYPQGVGVTDRGAPYVRVLWGHVH